MMTPFERELVEQLRPLPDHRLTAIVEMARLSPAERQQVFEKFGSAGYPILHQAHFANLRDIGPWLFCSGKYTSLQGQYDFHHYLSKATGDTPISWLIGPLPPSRLARHLGEAATARGPDGSTHLLRFYNEQAFPILHSRQDLPGIAHLLSPIRSWWLRDAELDLDDGEKGWRRYEGKDRADCCGVPPIHLDQACWNALTGDGSSQRLADLLGSLPGAPAVESCYPNWLAQVRSLLAKGRRLGLKQQADLDEFVLFLSLHGVPLRGSAKLEAAFNAAFKDAVDGNQTLAQALKQRLPPRLLTSQSNV